MKITQTLLLDANVILRFLLQDHPQHFLCVKRLFLRAEKRSLRCYLEPVTFAEVVWTLSSFYKHSRYVITGKLEKLLAQPWIVNEQKQTMLFALHRYESTTLDYIDCWLLAVSEEKHIPLETFDNKLKKKSSSI